LVESGSVDLRIFGVIGLALVLMSTSMLIVLIVQTHQRFWVMMAFLILIVPGLLLISAGYYKTFFRKWQKTESDPD
jgi:predicted transporter